MAVTVYSSISQNEDADKNTNSYRLKNCYHSRPSDSPVNQTHHYYAVAMHYVHKKAVSMPENTCLDLVKSIEYFVHTIRILSLLLSTDKTGFETIAR
jgi:hypothetical protein